MFLLDQVSMHGNTEERTHTMYNIPDLDTPRNSRGPFR